MQAIKGRQTAEIQQGKKKSRNWGPHGCRTVHVCMLDAVLYMSIYIRGLFIVVVYNIYLGVFLA